MASSPITSWQIEGKRWKQRQISSSWALKSLQMVSATMKLQDNCVSVGKLWEKAMAPHSSTLAWKIPWTQEPGRLQPIGLQRVGTRLSDFTSPFHFQALEKEMATHSSVLSCRENLRDVRAWWAAVDGVTQSRTRLMRLGGSSSSRSVSQRQRKFISFQYSK